MEKVDKFKHAINKECIEEVLFRKCFSRKECFRHRDSIGSEGKKERAFDVDVLGLSIHIRHIVKRFNQDGHKDYFRLVDLPKILYDTFSSSFTKIEIDYIAAMCLSEPPSENCGSSLQRQDFLTTKILIDFLCNLAYNHYSTSAQVN